MEEIADIARRMNSTVYGACHDGKIYGEVAESLKLDIANILIREGANMRELEELREWKRHHKQGG